MKELINKLEECLEKAKKLTTKDRKSMKESTFCGPNRSFPVNDCKHAATAKTYLNRSNFSKATRAKIASCINSKAKALGCPEGKPAKAKGEVDDEKFMNDPIWDSTKELISFFEDTAAKKAMMMTCPECDNEVDPEDNYCSNCGQELDTKKK